MNYNQPMKFEWDEDKSDKCFKERGFDFAYALRAFLDPKRIIRKDIRWSYGEDRYHLFGAIEHRVFIVVYTVRSSAVRIISARKANQREVTYYEDYKSDD